MCVCVWREGEESDQGITDWCENPPSCVNEVCDCTWSGVLAPPTTQREGFTCAPFLCRISLSQSTPCTGEMANTT